MLQYFVDFCFMFLCGLNMKRFHYAFLICVATTLTFFCIAGLACNAFSLHLPYILKEYGITNTQSSTILLTRSLFGFLSVAVSGWYYRTFSMRTGLLIAGLAAALGFVLYAFASHYYMFIAGSALTGIGYGLGATLPVSMMLNRWFRQKRNVAMSISTMGSTFALIGIPSLITWSIEHNGLSATFLAEAVCIGSIVILCFLIYRNSPADLGLHPFGDTDGTDGSGSAARKASPARRIIDKGDWFFLLPALFMLGVVANPGYNHLTVLLNGQGFRPETIAIAFSIGSVFASAGKFLFGWVADRFSTYWCNYIYGSLMVIGMALLCVVRSDPAMYISIAAFDVGVSIAMTGPAAWAGDLSEPEMYDETIQRFQKMYTFGSLVFTLVPGLIADRCGGSYVPAFWMFTAFGAFTIFAVQRQYLKMRRQAQ